MSGFFLRYSPFSDEISGYYPKNILYGRPDRANNYQKWDIQEGHWVFYFEAHADLSGEYIQYFKIKTRDMYGVEDVREFGDRVTEYDSDGSSYPG